MFEIGFFGDPIGEIKGSLGKEIGVERKKEMDMGGGYGWD